MFPFASFYSYSGKRGLTGWFDKTLSINAMRHEVMFQKTARAGQNIQSGFIFLQGKTVKVPLFVALVMVWSRVYGCDRWHHRLEAFDRFFFPSIIVFLFFRADFLDLLKHDTTCMKGFPSDWPSLVPLFVALVMVWSRVYGCDR